MKINNVLYLLVAMLSALIFSCNNSTGIQKGQVVGNVLLDGQYDHSGILVSIYKANVFSHKVDDVRNKHDRLGFPISDKELFDHREHIYIEQVYTNDNGLFRFSKLSYDKYVICYSKEGWGYNCFFEIELNQKELVLDSSELALYPETIMPNYIDYQFTLEEGKTYTANKDVAISDSGSLKFENNSKLLLADDAVVSVYGDLECPDLGYYAYISSISRIYDEDDGPIVRSEGLRVFGNNLDIKNLRFSYLRKALDVRGDFNQLSCLLMNNCDIGLLICNSNNIKLQKSVFIDNGGEETGSVNFYHSSSIFVEDNIFLSNTIGLRNDLVKTCQISNNAFIDNDNGFQNYWESETLFQNNYISSEGIGLENSDKSDLEIVNNDIYAKVCVKTSFSRNWYNTVSNGWTKANYNNFYATKFAVESRARYLYPDGPYPLDFKNNYWNTTSATRIDEVIIDYHDLGLEMWAGVSAVVEYMPFRQSKVHDAGIE